MDNKKYYCVLAISEEDPKKILGMYERPFSMSFEKNKVKLWYAYAYKVKEQIPTFKDKVRKIYYDKKRKFSKKKIRKNLGISKQQYYCYAKTGQDALICWRWVKHYAEMVKPPKGYKNYVFRINSKYCPIKIGMKADKNNYNFDII